MHLPLSLFRHAGTRSWGGSGSSGGVAASADGRKPAESIASLDGIRAIAISLVFLAHGGLQDIVPGGLGVTLFFVLSGFLITTLMRSEYAATGTLDLPAFYLRRIFRLTPPLLVMVMFALLLNAAARSHGPTTPLGVASVLFYFSNYFAIWVGPGIPDGLGVTWSLAVEEHFYIVFPVVAVFLLRFRRGAAAVPLGVICVGILLWRCWLYSHGASSGRVYMGTDTRIDSILVGCLMALVCNPVLDTVADRAQKYAWPACLAALAVLAATILYRGDWFRGTFRYTVQGLALVPLIYFAVADSQHAAFRWLNTAPMIYLGRVSYTVYLAHESCRFVVNEHWPDLGMVPTMAGTAVMTLAIAAVMRQWVELPFAGIRKRLHHRRALPLRASALVRADR